MAGRPSPQNPAINRLTSPPEPILSCYPENAPQRIPTTFRFRLEREKNSSDLVGFSDLFFRNPWRRRRRWLRCDDGRWRRYGRRWGCLYRYGSEPRREPHADAKNCTAYIESNQKLLVEITFRNLLPLYVPPNKQKPYAHTRQKRPRWGAVDSTACTPKSRRCDVMRSMRPAQSNPHLMNCQAGWRKNNIPTIALQCLNMRLPPQAILA